jgi:hypothetical protein
VTAAIVRLGITKRSCTSPRRGNRSSRSSCSNPFPGIHRCMSSRIPRFPSSLPKATGGCIGTGIGMSTTSGCNTTRCVPTGLRNGGIRTALSLRASGPFLVPLCRAFTRPKGRAHRTTLLRGGFLSR